MQQMNRITPRSTLHTSLFKTLIILNKSHGCSSAAAQSLQQSELAIEIQEYPYQKCKFSIVLVVCNANLPS